MSLTLYYHPLSSFCHKVIIALYEQQIAFEPRIINLGDAADRAELEALWPMIKFPVLRDHARQRDVPESSTIIEYLDDHEGAAGRLIPPQWEQALDVRQWDRVFDHYVQRPLQEIVANQFRTERMDMQGQRATLAQAYRMIDARMAGRTWVGAEQFSMADCAAAPALFYASTLVPFGEQAQHLHAYFERLIARPSVKRVLEEAKPFLAMYPFAEAIPERFR